MTKNRPLDLSASVRQRLMDQARNSQEDVNLLLTRYALERLLYRLSQSRHRNQFILKGAMLFQIWTSQSHRPTRDLDLLGYGLPEPATFASVFREICQLEVEEDGLEFQKESVQAEQMREGEDYEGLRIKLLARLGTARIPIQIDIGFGDAITPSPDEILYPTLLEFPAPQLRVYPRETVIAEKFQAMVSLGMSNSRMKDFFDIWTLSQHFNFSGAVLSSAIQATFERRKTPIPATPPLALTSEFSTDRQKQTQWTAFIRKGKLNAEEKTLQEMISLLKIFLMPPAQSISAASPFDLNWSPDNHWQP